MTLKDRVKALAQERGISLPALESELGFGNSTIVKWDKSTPNADKLNAVAKYFNVTMDYLYGMEKSTSISTVNLSGKQADILRSLADMFRRQNGLSDKKISEEQYALLGKIVCEMMK